MKPRFQVKYIEISPENPLDLDKYKITAVNAVHTALTNPLALRIETGSKKLVYTGDGALTDALIDLTLNADLAIAECYYFDKAIKWHLNYPDIQNLKADKVILTHMHENMLIHKEEVEELCAYDGLLISL